MPQVIGLFVALGVAGLAVGLVLVAAYFFVVYVLPFLLAGGCIYWAVKHPYYKVRDRYNEDRSRYDQISIPDRAKSAAAILALYIGELREHNMLPPSKAIGEALGTVLDDLYDQEVFTARFTLPERPEFQWKVRPNYRPLLAELATLETAIDRLPEVKRRFERGCAYMLVKFTFALPRSARRTWEEFSRDIDEPPGFLAIPLYDAMPEIGEVASNLAYEFLNSEAMELELFTSLRTAYVDNATALSERRLKKTDLSGSEIMHAHEYSGDSAEIAQGYFAGTPWYPLFTMPVPFNFDKVRFEHQWIVAPTGSGKTQLLKAQIAADLHKVARGEASIVVMDSQGTKRGSLVGDLIRLKLFAPGQPLDDRLVFLDPDPAHPLALNLFDFGVEEMQRLSERERRAYLTSVIDLAEFIINGLVGAEQTAMMKGLSRYIIQALMVVPGATIETFRDLMAKGGYERVLRPHAAKLDDYTRDFFETRFNAQQYEASKHGIFWRIDTMMSDPTFREMFLNERNRLDLAKELNAGKVIVVNTDRELLKADGTEAFGRFILAKLLLATQQRASLPHPMPTFVYIDECQDYIAEEERIADLIDKARKQNVGLVFAHQRLSNIRSSNVADALANTAIQFAGGNKTDAAILARSLRTEPEFIENQPALSFAAYVKGQTDRAIRISVPYGAMEKMEKMTREEEAQMRQTMRERYSVSKRHAIAAPTAAANALPPTKWDD
jgi:hypothetical protein